MFKLRALAALARLLLTARVTAAAMSLHLTQMRGGAFVWNDAGRLLVERLPAYGASNANL